jgi:hypothetical protein
MIVVTEKGDFKIPDDEKILNLTAMDRNTFLIGTSTGMYKIEDGVCEKIVETDWKLPIANSG